MNYLKINSSDVFSFHDKKIIPFNNIEECIKICMTYKYTAFVIYNNTVYFRNNKFKDLILNLKYFEKSDSYLIIPNNLICNFLFSEKYRVNFYCKGILKDKILIESNNSFTIEKLQNKINNDYKEGERNWDKQHHENLLKYINNMLLNDDIKYNFLFKLNWYDLSYGIKEPTFVKSRPKKNYYKSVLLPLEDLYLFSNELHKIKNDISFEKKKNGIVWRGANSGFSNEKHRANRYDLVSKFYNHKNKNFNIGFSYMNYNKIEQEKNNNFIKGLLSIEEQLKYKFILSIEGNDFATNLLWILLSNSIPICPVHYIETWSMETKLKPWIHYVPIKNDFSDLEKNFQKISKNKKLCNEILLNKKLFAFQFLDKEKEMNIIKQTIELYRKNTNENIKDYLYNKRIAIVGPSNSIIGKKYGKIIDKYDVVIRLGEYYKLLGDDYGYKTNIIIYNFFNNTPLITRKEIKYICNGHPLKHRHVDNTFFYNKSKNDVNKNINHIILPNIDINLTSFPTIGYFSLIQLLYNLNNFKELSIFSLDFYLNGYNTIYDNRQIMPKKLVHHDYFEERMSIKKIFKKLNINLKKKINIYDMNFNYFINSKINSICLICYRPNNIWCDFLNTFRYYQVYIIIDDNDFDINIFKLKYDYINFIKIENKKCNEFNFKNTNYFLRKEISGWDKAIYYFCNENYNYDNVWFMEDDVFFYNEITLINLDKKYDNYDYLAKKWTINKDGAKNYWHWNNIDLKFKPPFYNSLQCITRMSKKMLFSIKKYVKYNKTLTFLEELFPTIAIKNNLTYFNPVELNETIIYRHEWKIENINKNDIYHPIKNIEQHSLFRNI